MAGAGRNCEREINAIPRRHCRGVFQFQPIPDHRLEHHGDVGDVGADPEDVWNAGLKAAAGQWNQNRFSRRNIDDSGNEQCKRQLLDRCVPIFHR